MRAVLDTNVLIAAYITEGLCSRLLRRAQQGQCALITCPLLLKERRQNLHKLTGPLPEVLHATILHLQAITTLVTPAPSFTPQICRHLADNVVLGCALTAHADYLVTSDHDLLDLHPFPDLHIVSPRDFESLFAE